MTRQDKVQACNALALNQRRKGYAVGSQRWKQCGFELIQAMNRLSPAAAKFVDCNFNNNAKDWVSELSVL